MDFVISLLISTNLQRDSDDTILIIVDCLTKMVHYEQVKIMVDVVELAKVIINIVIKY